MTFSLTFVSVLIYGAIALCAINCCVLLLLLVKEWKSGRIWK